MSSLIANVGAIVLLCGALSGGSLQTQDPVDLRRPIPDAVMTASEADRPTAFAHALAALGVPAGFAFTGRQDAGELISIQPDTPTGRHALSEAVANFRRKNPGYRVDPSDGLLAVSESSVCAPALEQPVTLETGGTYLEVLDRVAGALMPTNTDPKIPPGIVHGGSSHSKATDAEAFLFSRPVRVKAVAAPLRSVLMDMSRQVPGVVWSVQEVLTEDGQVGDCVLTMLTAQHALYTSYTVR